jgi:hypothetical protein
MQSSLRAFYLVPAGALSPTSREGRVPDTDPDRARDGIPILAVDGVTLLVNVQDAPFVSFRDGALDDRTFFGDGGGI